MQFDRYHVAATKDCGSAQGEQHAGDGMGGMGQGVNLIGKQAGNPAKTKGRAKHKAYPRAVAIKRPIAQRVENGRGGKDHRDNATGNIGGRRIHQDKVDAKQTATQKHAPRMRTPWHRAPLAADQ